jgi:hypothetical protein
VEASTGDTDGLTLLKVDTLTTAVDSLKAYSAGGEAPGC